MAQIRTRVVPFSGCELLLDVQIGFLEFRMLVMDLLGDLNRLGTWQKFGGKGYVKAEDLADQYSNSGGLQRFLDSNHFRSDIINVRLTCVGFHEFDLVVSRTKEIGEMSFEKWAEINREMYRRGCMVISSRKSVKGFPVKVIIAKLADCALSELDLLHIFLSLTGAGKTPYQTGILYSEGP